MKQLVITRMWREISKQQYVVIATLLNTIGKHFTLNFQIGISHKINKHFLSTIELFINAYNKKNDTNHSFTLYTVDEIDNFLKSEYELDNKHILSLKNQLLLYNLFLALMIRKKLDTDYCLFYDDDVLLNTKNPTYILELLEKEKPFGVEHPMAYGDLSLVGKFTLLFNFDFFGSFIKKAPSSISTGFCGYKLSVLDNISDKETFHKILETTKQESVEDDSNLFFDGVFSYLLYSQEQSILSLLLRRYENEFVLLSEKDNMGIYLTIDELMTKLPVVHHYIFDLKKQEHFTNIIDYYYNRIIDGKDLYLN